MLYYLSYYFSTGYGLFMCLISKVPGSSGFYTLMLAVPSISVVVISDDGTQNSDDVFGGCAHAGIKPIIERLLQVCLSQSLSHPTTCAMLVDEPELPWHATTAIMPLVWPRLALPRLAITRGLPLDLANGSKPAIWPGRRLLHTKYA